MAPKTARERKQDEVVRRKAQGLVRRSMWVFPEAWEAICAFAEKANRKARSSNPKPTVGDIKDESQ